MSNTTKEKKDYYFTDVAEYLKADYENKPSKEKAIISGIEEQIKTLLKNPEAYSRAEEMMQAENKRRKESKQRGAAGISDENREIQFKKMQEGNAIWRIENPEEAQAAADKAAITNRERGHYKATSERMKEYRANQPLEEKQAMGKTLNDILSATPGKRKSIAKKGNITKEKNRNENLKKIYETIQETGWFTKKEIHAKYKFKGVNGKLIGSQQLNNVFSNAVELGLFESKFMNVTLLNGGARRMYYTKVVESKDVDYKSLNDKVNSDNDKVRALRLTDKDYLAKQDSKKLKKEKDKEIKNKKAIKKLKTILSKEFTQKEASEASIKIGFTTGWVYTILRNTDFCIKTNDVKSPNQFNPLKYSFK